MSEKRFVNIDPGHGGSDPGAVAAGVEEEDITLASAVSLGHELRLLDIGTALTRSDDTFIAVMDRADHVDPGELFVSLHVNSCGDAKPNGVSVWYHGAHVPSKRLAEHIFNAIYSLHWLGRYGAGVISDTTRYANGFGVLREATQRGAAGAVLIELGFIPNEKDRMVISDQRKRNLIAKAIAAAIQDFFKEIGK